MLVAFAPNTIHSRQLLLIASEHLVPLFALAAIFGIQVAQETGQRHADTSSVTCRISQHQPSPCQTQRSTARAPPLPSTLPLSSTSKALVLRIIEGEHELQRSINLLTSTSSYQILGQARCQAQPPHQQLPLRDALAKRPPHPHHRLLLLHLLGRRQPPPQWRAL